MTVENVLEPSPFLTRTWASAYERQTGSASRRDRRNSDVCKGTKTQTAVALPPNFDGGLCCVRHKLRP